jgi:ABC-type branched-subunit amino acid transport system substrate-binding protein
MLTDQTCAMVLLPTNDRFQGQAAARLLIGKGYRNVAMVYEDAAYGYGLAFNFIAAFTKGEHQVASTGFGTDCNRVPHDGTAVRCNPAINIKCRAECITDAQRAYK